ncbi:hypothetical protein Tco_0630694 [Tanacetum coccineum]
MASLDIPSEANDEDADIIFDYSSDENPYENPYTEYNFAQKRKKSYVDEDLQREFDYKPPTQTERYLYQQGKIRTKKNKWEQIPPQYIPKIPITRMDNDILNLDCETNIDEIIQGWNNRLSAQIQLTEELRVLHPRDLLNFIIHRTSGNVYRFIESLNELELSRIATTDAMTTFKNVVARIVQEFTGRIPGVIMRILVQRKERRKKRILKNSYDLGYEPLEDSDIDSDIEIYAYTNSSDYSSDTSSNHE